MSRRLTRSTELLQALVRCDSRCGAELAREIHCRADAAYRLLKILKKAGFLVSAWNRDLSPHQHLYSLTEQGRMQAGVE